MTMFPTIVFIQLFERMISIEKRKKGAKDREEQRKEVRKMREGWNEQCHTFLTTSTPYAWADSTTRAMDEEYTIRDLMGEVGGQQ